MKVTTQRFILEFIGIITIFCAIVFLSFLAYEIHAAKNDPHFAMGWGVPTPTEDGVRIYDYAKKMEALTKKRG